MSELLVEKQQGVPEGWHLVEMQSVLGRVVGGGTPSRSNPAYWGDEIPWVTVKDFATYSPISAQESITKKGLENSSSNLIPRGTLITSTRMALGKAVIYEVDVAINQDLKALFTKISLATKFLYYWFEANSNKIEELGSGSTVKGLSLSDLRRIPILLPPIKEQTAIATALSDVDELLSSLEALIAKKQAIKTATMQQLLSGRTRLPQFALREDGSPKGYKSSELGEIPEDWAIKALGSIATINMGHSPKSSNYNRENKGLPLIQGNADISNRKTILRNYTSQITQTAQKGDLILSVRAPVGEVAKATFDCCIGRGVCAINYKNDYLYQWLISFESEWGKFSKGSTFDSINSHELKGILLSVPLEDEQLTIASILSDMDTEIEALEKQLNKTQQIKQGMMQQLLTGKIRLVNPN